MVRAQVLDVDVEKERISLGIKQLAEDPFQAATSGIKKGDRVTCTVKEVTAGGIEVETTTGPPGSSARSSSPAIATSSARSGSHPARRSTPGS